MLLRTGEEEEEEEEGEGEEEEEEKEEEEEEKEKKKEKEEEGEEGEKHRQHPAPLLPKRRQQRASSPRFHAYYALCQLNLHRQRLVFPLSKRACVLHLLVRSSVCLDFFRTLYPCFISRGSNRFLEQLSYIKNASREVEK